MKQVLLLIALFCIICSSCEKAISFRLADTQPSLVVEASIENGQPPVVILSSSFDYFSSISADILAGSFVHNAVISMSNGAKTHQLKEYFYTTPANGKVYYYSIDSSSLATAFTGAFNTAYALSIAVNGKTYTANTTIPAFTKRVDSLWWKYAPDNPDSNKVVLVGTVTDPRGYGNYIRYFTKTNRDPFFPGLNSVFDDQVVDGKTYTVDVERGVNRNEDIDQDNYSFFNKGDTITVKFANIDKACYDFWRTMEYSYGSIGNPFASPTKVLGNINGALGYFGGYAAQYKSIIVPK
ncbi:MAG: DUF4249 domain-containing protein [Chitinophagaceae bacterium]